MHWELSFDNKSPELIQAIEDAVQFVETNGASNQALYHVRFVLEEMGTNILKYGYDDADTHRVYFRVDLTADTVQVLLEDDGHEFDPTKTAAPDTTLPLEQRTPGGLGLMLVRKLVRRLDYERRDGKNYSTILITR